MWLWRNNKKKKEKFFFFLLNHCFKSSEASTIKIFWELVFTSKKLRKSNAAILLFSGICRKKLHKMPFEAFIFVFLEGSSSRHIFVQVEKESLITVKKSLGSLKTVETIIDLLQTILEKKTLFFFETNFSLVLLPFLVCPFLFFFV